MLNYAITVNKTWHSHYTMIAYFPQLNTRDAGRLLYLISSNIISKDGCRRRRCYQICKEIIDLYYWNFLHGAMQHAEENAFL